MVVISATTAAQPHTSDGLFVMQVGHSQAIYRNTNYNDATTALRVFLRDMAIHQGTDTDFEVELFADPDRFEAALNRNVRPLHMSVVLAWDYLQMELPETVQPLFVIADRQAPGRHWVLLTRRDGGLDQLEDLRGKTVLDYDLKKYTQGRAWIETLLHEGGMPSPEDFFGRTVSTSKANAAVLPVFFGNGDACIVDEPSFTIITELNPQISNVLQVIARSSTLADVVICISKTGWPNQERRQMAIDALEQLKNTPEGRQILTLFKISHIEPFEEQHLNASRDLLRRWQKIPRASRP